MNHINSTTGTEEAFAELDAWEQQQGEDFAEVQKVLTGAAGRTKTTTLKFGNERVEIRHLAAFPLELRGEMAKIATTPTDPEASPAEQNRPLYEVLAKICTEKPWNDWRVWLKIDVETGETPNVFEQILKNVAEPAGPGRAR
jgi:predicted metalloendopeptidase